MERFENLVWSGSEDLGAAKVLQKLGALSWSAFLLDALLVLCVWVYVCVYVCVTGANRDRVRTDDGQFSGRHLLQHDHSVGAVLPVRLAGQHYAPAVGRLFQLVEHIPLVSPVYLYTTAIISMSYNHNHNKKTCIAHAVKEFLER